MKHAVLYLTLFLILIFIFVLASGSFLSINKNSKINSPLSASPERFWTVQSIDTMKYSRDPAREKLNDPSFDSVINEQVGNIARTGVTHVAIATPYDAEFVPFLKRWVNAARSNGLKVWYRGNFSGWEKWFNYPSIDRASHIIKTKEFIVNNQDLFEDGDIFVSCPECENGGPGDPRLNGDVNGHKKFLIDEHEVVENTFKEIDKDVITNYYSMNGDVAKLIMDKETTKTLGGIISIDHYVRTPEKLIDDIHTYAVNSGGDVVLGEWGAPIPDINGQMTDDEQAEYIGTTLKKLLQSKDVVAINYWVNRGGSTELWNEDGTPRPAVGIITKYYSPHLVYGDIKDVTGRLVPEVSLQTNGELQTIQDGNYSLLYVDDVKLVFSKQGYKNVVVNLNPQNKRKIEKNIYLTKINNSPLEKFVDYFRQRFHK